MLDRLTLISPSPAAPIAPAAAFMESVVAVTLASSSVVPSRIEPPVLRRVVAPAVIRPRVTEPLATRLAACDFASIVAPEPMVSPPLLTVMPTPLPLTAPLMVRPPASTRSSEPLALIAPIVTIFDPIVALPRISR